MQRQQWQNFKKFGDSLLSKSAKLGDLVSSVESYEGEVKEDSGDAKRLTKQGSYEVDLSSQFHCPHPFIVYHSEFSLGLRCKAALEAATDIVEIEYENVQQVKAETSALSTLGAEADENKVQEHPASIKHRACIVRLPELN